MQRSSAVQAHYATVGKNGWRMDAENKMKRLGIVLGGAVLLMALSGCVVDDGYYGAGYRYNGGYGYSYGQSYGRGYGSYNRGYDRDRDRDDYDRRDYDGGR